MPFLWLRLTPVNYEKKIKRRTKCRRCRLQTVQSPNTGEALKVPKEKQKAWVALAAPPGHLKAFPAFEDLKCFQHISSMFNPMGHVWVFLILGFCHDFNIFQLASSSSASSPSDCSWRVLEGSQDLWMPFTIVSNQAGECRNWLLGSVSKKNAKLDSWVRSWNTESIFLLRPPGPSCRLT